MTRRDRSRVRWTPATLTFATVMMALAGGTAGSAWSQVPATPAPAPAPPPAPTRAPVSIVSDDGRLTVDIPVGEQPGEVMLAAVVVPTSLPAVTAYQLRPLDQTFRTPATVTWRPGAAGPPLVTGGDLTWLGMARTDDPIGGPWSWLEDPRIAVVDGGYTLTGELTRFGTLIVTELPTLIRGPEAVWGLGYAPGRGVDVPLELSLVERDGTPGAAAFSGDWRFGGGYPDRIGVTQTVAQADRLTASWRCQRTGATTLTTTFGVREDAADPSPDLPVPGFGPAAAAFSVAFPVSCGATHAQPNG